MITSFPPAKPRVAKGMQKVSIQQLTRNSTFTQQVTSWGARSGFASGPTGNTIVVEGSGSYDIAGAFDWQIGAFGGTRGLQVRRNGTSIVSVENTDNDQSVSLTNFALVDGDVLTVYGYADAANSTTRVIGQGTGTYLTITPV